MRAASLLILLLTSSLAFGQIYSWRDADGRMHYSDTPPIGADAKKMNAPPPATDDGGAAARKALADKELDFKKRQSTAAEAAAKADKEKKAETEKQANCAQARGNLQALESGQIRYKTDGNGGRVGLDGALRDEEIAKARSVVQSWCK